MILGIQSCQNHIEFFLPFAFFAGVVLASVDFLFWADLGVCFTSEKKNVEALTLPRHLYLTGHLPNIQSKNHCFQVVTPLLAYIFFLRPPSFIEPTCAYARWAHMHRFLSVWPSVWLDQNSLDKKSKQILSQQPFNLGSWNLVRPLTLMTPRLTLRVKVIGPGHQVKKRYFRSHLTIL